MCTLHPQGSTQHSPPKTVRTPGVSPSTTTTRIKSIVIHYIITFYDYFNFNSISRTQKWVSGVWGLFSLEPLTPSLPPYTRCRVIKITQSPFPIQFHCCRSFTFEAPQTRHVSLTRPQEDYHQQQSQLRYQTEKCRCWWWWFDCRRAIINKW